MDSSRIVILSDEIVQRQKTLSGDYSLSSAIVIGLGGIGSWVAIDLALLGVGTVILFDDDVIEASNLNRTLFKLSHVGRPKTEAVKELIMERRKDTLVVTYNDKFALDVIEKYRETEYIFDCSDTSKIKNEIGQYRKENLTNPKALFPYYVKLGYDGFDGTICINDFDKGSWGEDSSYTITPSFFGTPQILSAFAVIEMLMKQKSAPKTVNMNVKQVINLLEMNRRKN